MKKARPVPLELGDRVRCGRPHSPLDGLVGRVTGLRVRSCDGRLGIAVQYSARGYVVLDPAEAAREPSS